MTAITPSGEMPQPTGSIQPSLKAAVLAIAAAQDVLTIGSRMTGTVERDAVGQMRIRTAAGLITIAAIAGLDDGAPVALTLRREAGTLVAHIQPGPPAARPVSPNASSSGPRPVAAAPLATVTTAGSPTTPRQPLPLAGQPAAAPVSNAPPKPSAALALPAGTSLTAANEPATTPGNPGGARMAPRRLDGEPSPGLRRAAATMAAAPVGAATGTDRATPSARPGALAADPTVAATAPVRPIAGVELAASASPAQAAVPDGGQPLGSRPRPPLDPATFLDLQQSVTADQTAGDPVPIDLPPSAAKPSKLPRLDLDRFSAALAALIETHPPLARSLLTTAVPQPNRRLGAVLFAFVAALGRGDTAAFLGPDLAGRLATASPALAECFAAMADDRPEPAATGTPAWRDAQLPLLTPTGMLPVRVMVQEKPQDQRSDHPGEAAEATSRLILECRFSRFDSVQLDMLVRKPHRCDVIVRSAAPLPADVQAMVLEAFTSISDQTGLTGAIGFQVGSAGLIDPQPSDRAAPASATISLSV